MSIIGTTKPIHDAVEKATGRAVYAGDMVLPGMRFVAMLWSPLPHALVKSIDASMAEAVPGVAAVLHCFNTTQQKFTRYRNRKWQMLPDDERIFNDRVRFIGDRVACVVADTPEIAKKAVSLIKVEYEELPFTTDMYETLSGKIDGIHGQSPAFKDFEIEYGENHCTGGEVEVETSSHLSRISHITMEPHACVADYNPATKRLTVYSPNQSVHGIRTVLGDLFEIPYNRIRVVKTTMGGSFGSKQEWMLEPVASAAAMAVGGPVKMVLSRAEAMVSTVVRSPLDAVVTSQITPDGLIKSIEADVTLNAGAYLGNSFDYMCVIGKKFFRCYAIPHVHYTGKTVYTNTPVSGAFRGWGSPELAIMLEHNLNMAARKLNIDPVELRLLNAAPPGTIDLSNENTLGEIRTKECLERGQELFEWDKKRDADKVFNRENNRYKRGTGVGCGGHINGYFPRVQDFATVEMRMAEDGSVFANITLHDHGCGAVTVNKMIIAETLGLSIENIHFGEGDTDFTPLDIGCLASRTVYVLGRTAKDCAEKLKRKLLEGVAELSGADFGDLYVKDGRVCSPDGKIDYSYGEAATLIMRDLQRELRATYKYINKSNPGAAGAHFAHIEADTFTGIVKILDYVAVHDIGRAINPEMCRAQIQGAVLIGSGAALSECLPTDAKTGKPVSSLKNYHLINAPDAPRIQVELVEGGGDDGPFGAKGIGESSHVPVAPAIIGAVNEALGSELCSIPLNPDTIVDFVAGDRKEGCLE